MGLVGRKGGGMRGRGNESESEWEGGRKGEREGSEGPGKERGGRGIEKDRIGGRGGSDLVGWWISNYSLGLVNY